MPSSPTAAELLRGVGLIADGPAIWGKPVRLSAPGVFIVEMATPAPSAPLDLAIIGKWLERVPDLLLDGVRPTSKDLQQRIGSFWLPSQPVLYIGSTPGSVAGRIAAIVKTVPGDRKPAASGLWLHFLRNPGDLRVWWAKADALEEYEDALLEAFSAGITDADRPVGPKGVMTVPASRLPWAVLRSPSGVRKETGIANPTLAEVKAPEPKPVTRIVTFPTGEADGARDEAKRPRRPAPGRGVGRVASAAGYAAQGSPRKPPPEPVLVSAEGLERLQAELAELLAERPGVIKRIATAREHGDLKENAEYHAAREEQGFLEGRIKALEAKLKVAQVVAPTERGARVEIGSHVKLDEDGEETVEWQVVGSAEANSREGRISSVSPVGAALMGRRVGDEVAIVTPGGEIHYRILAID
jgi:transcription elongation factor GreA